MRRRKRKVKIKSFVILFVMVIGIILLINGFKKKPEERKIIDYQSYVSKDILELEKQLGDKNATKEYEFSNELESNKIIEIIEENDTLKVIISKGKIDDNVYKEKQVNELGKVPIMMYHGIIDTEENEYIGGNVDKDGYNRTANAFRKDLEMYYEKGYRMIRLADYVKGIIDVELGYSPIIITFDDGNQNNFHVLEKKDDGTLEIDPECAIGVLEEFKKKHPDANVTATFFVMDCIFNQSKYNKDILNWLVEHGYDVGNHTTIHPDFTKIDIHKTQEVVGKMYQKLDNLLSNKYVKIVALPFGSPYKKTHENYPYILKGTYNGFDYETEAALRVGWEPEVSPFNKDFDKTFLKRCRAYDNNGKDFDIEFVFKGLEKTRYISDGNKDLIVIKEKDMDLVNKSFTNIHTY